MWLRTLARNHIDGAPEGGSPLYHSGVLQLTAPPQRIRMPDHPVFRFFRGFTVVAKIRPSSWPRPGSFGDIALRGDTRSLFTFVLYQNAVGLLGFRIDDGSPLHTLHFISS
jgi:hypothetical protein